MNITIAGPYRTGSTRIFNLIKFVIESSKGLNCISYLWNKDEIKKEYEITKCHFFHEKLISWSDLIVTSKRDIRYIMSSCWDFFEKKENTHNFEWLEKLSNVVINHYESWKPHSNYEIIYENWNFDKEIFIYDISKIIKCQFKPEEVLQKIKLQTTRIMESKPLFQFDKSSLENKNHISKNTDKHFSERLEKKYIDYLEKNYSKYCYI